MLIKLYTLLVVLYPILSAYTVMGSIDLGIALCSFVGMIVFVAVLGKKRIIFPEGYGAFLFYVTFVAILVTHALPLRILLYSFVLIVGCMVCEFDKLYKYYKQVAYICICFFLFQEIVLLATGNIVPGIFTFLPTVYGDSASFISNRLLESNRPSSFFLEPSYLAQFLYPLVAMELFWNKDNNHLRNAVIHSFIIFLIRSGNGILLLGIIWSIWIIFSDVRKIKKYTIVFLGGIGAIAMLAFKPDFILELLSRTQELTISGAEDRHLSSGFIRFFRGYYLYFSLPTINQIFGVNPAQLEDYMLSNSLGLFDRDTAFLNGIQTILCLYGCIGAVFYFRHVYLFGKQSESVCKVLLVGTVYLLLSESYFICSRMLLVMVLLFKLKHKDENAVYNKHLSSRE